MKPNDQSNKKIISEFFYGGTNRHQEFAY